MTNMNEMNKTARVRETNSAELARIAGGDYGDSVKELTGSNTRPGVNFTYHSGSTVEVYTNFLHLTTRRARVVCTWVKNRKGRCPVAMYTVMFEDGNTNDVSADDIESGSNNFSRRLTF